jgi:osmotically-inducible protein OsmY
MIFTLPRLALTTIASCCLAAALSACAPLVIGGAAMGSMVAVDRRTSGAQLEDEGIELRAASRLRDVMGERSHFNITSYNRQVLLTGEVSSEQDKHAIEQIVGKVENVRSVINDMGVMPASSITQRSSDTLTTGKVKASLVDDKLLQAGAFKVVTERGTTYLMGLVTPREAERATNLTRSVGGVQRVVRVFEMISDEDLRRISSTPPQQETPRPTP